MENRRPELLQTVVRVFKKMTRMGERFLEQYGLLAPEYGILRLLGDNELTLSELSERTMRVNSHITALIDKMETKGLVQRIRDRNDRRVVRVSLTDAGRKLRDEVIPIHHSYISRVMAPLSDTEIAELIRLLKRLETVYDQAFKGENTY